jgi:hypothetical protein
MKYTIGAYSLDVDKPFESLAHAVKFVQEYHPELNEEEIKAYLRPKIRDHADNSSGTRQKIEESGEGTSKVSKGRAETVQNGKDKPK